MSAAEHKVTLTGDEPEECWGCGGDRLPLTCYPAEGYGVGPAATDDRWLCEVCSHSYCVSRASSGGSPLRDAEQDVLIGTHLILAALAALTVEEKP